MAYENTRQLKDIYTNVSVALAQAGAQTPSIDLTQTTGGEIENIAAEISLPAAAWLGDAKTLTVVLQDSADGTNFTNVDPLIQTTVTGAGGVGAAAKKVNFRFPPGTRRYVRLNQTATATAGTFAGNLEFSLLY